MNATVAHYLLDVEPHHRTPSVHIPTWTHKHLNTWAGQHWLQLHWFPAWYPWACTVDAQWKRVQTEAVEGTCTNTTRAGGSMEWNMLLQILIPPRVRILTVGVTPPSAGTKTISTPSLWITSSARQPQRHADTSRSREQHYTNTERSSDPPEGNHLQVRDLTCEQTSQITGDAPTFSRTPEHQ